MNMIKKRCITFIMAFFIVFNTVAVAPMQVHASGALTMTVVESLLALFGLELGLGNQSKFFNNSEFVEFVDAVVDGRTVNMPLYGDVNFSDEQSIMSWIMWGYNTNAKLSGNELVDVALGTSIVALSKALDTTSYASTGSSATNVMGNKIDILKAYYNTATDFVGEVKDAFGTMVGKSDGIMTRTRWDIITGMISTLMYSTADTMSGLISKLKNPQDTVYTDYSDFYVSSEGYNPKALLFKYTNMSNPDYTMWEDYYIIGYGETRASPSYQYVPCTYLTHKDLIYGNYRAFGVLQSDGSVSFHQYSFSSDSVAFKWSPDASYYQPEVDKYYNVRNYSSVGWSYSVASKLNVPIFENQTDAKAYFKNGAIVPILNAVDGVDVYPAFKEDVGINTLDISDMIKQLIDTVPSVDDISKAIPSVLERADDAVGTHTAILDMTTAIADIGGILVDNQVQNNANAKGIIGAIQAQTKSLIDGLKDALKWLLDSLQDVLLSAYKVAVLPDTEYWKRELDIRVEAINTKASVLVLPLSIITLLFGTITNASGIPDFVLTIPPIEYKGYVLYEGCSFNFNQFLAQDMFRDLHNLFIVISDAMIAFWLVRYASKNFDEIIKGK